MLSKKAKYAINALVYLGHHREEAPILISEISTKENIPQKFLESILLDLKKSGYLGSKKGRGGGYYLIKELDEINMADIIRVFDGPLALLPCVTHKYYERCEECVDEERCGIRKVFMELRNVTVELLKNSTLQRIIEDEKK